MEDIKNKIVFSAIEAPELADCSRKSIVRYLDDLVQYERKRVENGEVNFKITFKNTIKSSLLRTICVFEIGKQVEDVSEEELNNFFKEKVGDDDSQIVVLDSILDRIKMDMSIDDAEARLMDLFMEINESIREHRLERLIEHPKVWKKVEKKMISCLKPSSVKKVIENKLLLVKIKSLKELYDVTAEVVIAQERFFRASQANYDSDDQNKIKNRLITSKYKVDEKQKHSSKQFTKNNYSNNNTPNVAGYNGKNEPKTPKEDQKIVCFKCGKDGHKSFECKASEVVHRPVTRSMTANVSSSSPNQAFSYKDAVKNIRTIKLSENNKRVLENNEKTVEFGCDQVLHVNSVDSINDTCPMLNGRILGSKEEIKCLLDTGAEASIISRNLLPSNLIYERTYGKNIVGINGKGRIIGEIILQFQITENNEERITFPNYKFYVIEECINYLIIGNPQLKSVGWDIMKFINSSMDIGLNKVSIFDSKEGRVEANGDDLNILQNFKSTAVFQEMFPVYEELVDMKSKKLMDLIILNWHKVPPNNNIINVPKMVLKLVPNNKIIRSKVRQYTETQLESMKIDIENHLAAGTIYMNPNARFTSPVLMVPKGEGFRMVVDYARVNQIIQEDTWPMPLLVNELRKLRSKILFGKIDLKQGYYQIGLDYNSQDYLSFITPFGTYSPTRVMQGVINGVHHFQFSMDLLLKNFKDNVIVWLDDILFFADDEASFIILLIDILDCLLEANCKINYSKSIFCAKDIEWNGLHISTKGINMSSKNIDKILEIPLPDDGTKLSQLVHGANWLRKNIPNFSQVVGPLENLLNDMGKELNSRRKKPLEKLVINWTPKLLKSFEDLKKAIGQSLTLSHRDPSKLLVVMTDASDLYHSGFIFQTSNIHDIIQELDLELLGLSSGKFTNSSIRWSAIEKEAFAFLHMLNKFAYILHDSKGFTWFTDNRNLTFLFDSSKNIEGNKILLDKLTRWCLYARQFKYDVKHIEGKKNFLCDLFTRWGQPIINENKTITNEPDMDVFHIHRVHLLNSTKDDDFSVPQLKDIVTVQKEYLKLNPITKDMYIENDVLKLKEKIFIPDLHDFRKKIIILSHSGIMGHYGIDRTLRTISKYFIWDELHDDVVFFIQNCIHCTQKRDITWIPRVYGDQIYGNAPNDLIQFDYTYMNLSYSGDKFIFVIKDSFSGYCWLIATKHADSLNAASSILKWYSTFGPSKGWMSDRGSHFLGGVVAELKTITNIQHHITIAYTPQANGSVERINKEIKSLIRALCSEYRIGIEKWTDILPLVQFILNNTGSKRLNDYCPLKIFTGLEPNNVLETILLDEKIVHIKYLADFQKQYQQHILNLQQELQSMHTEVTNSIEKQKQKNLVQSVHVAKNINFGVGDYVLIARPVAEEKIKMKWTGPHLIVKIDVSDLVFEVQNAISGEKFFSHSSRMKLYQPQNFSNLSVSELEQVAFNDKEYRFEIEKLHELHYNHFQNRFEFQVYWKGFDAIDATFEPVENLVKDVPNLVFSFFDKNIDDPTVAKLLKEDLELNKKFLKFMGKILISEPSTPPIEIEEKNLSSDIVPTHSINVKTKVKPRAQSEIPEFQLKNSTSQQTSAHGRIRKPKVRLDL